MVAGDAFFPTENIGAHPPLCGTGHAMILAARAVPSAVADHGLLVHLQRADDAWLRLMICGRAAPVTTVAMVLSEVLIGTLKGIYDRARPLGSLVATSGTSFPSGHSVAATVTVVAAVIALVPPGRARVAWGAAAAAFSVLMALSRAYLGARWLSDALAGVLLGASGALLSAFAVGERQGRRTAHRAARSAHPPIPGTVRPADR
jgi:membrane-associated phospholipid phosphatase